MLGPIITISLAILGCQAPNGRFLSTTHPSPSTIKSPPPPISFQIRRPHAPPRSWCVSSITIRAVVIFVVGWGDLMFLPEPTMNPCPLFGFIWVDKCSIPVMIDLILGLIILWAVHNLIVNVYLLIWSTIVIFMHAHLTQALSIKLSYWKRVDIELTIQIQTILIDWLPQRGQTWAGRIVVAWWAFDLFSQWCCWMGCCVQLRHWRDIVRDC